MRVIKESKKEEEEEEEDGSKCGEKSNFLFVFLKHSFRFRVF
jgi:hypothetical protein